jgi:hypothetical protein
MFKTTVIIINNNNNNTVIIIMSKRPQLRHMRERRRSYKEYEAATDDGMDWESGTAIDGCEAGASQPRGGSHKDSWQN